MTQPPLSQRIPDERVIDPASIDAGFESGVYVPLNQISLGSGGQAELNGNLAVSFVGSTFEGSLDEEGEAGPAAAHVGLRGAATLELTVTEGTDVSTVLRLAAIPLPAFSVGVLTVTPQLQLRLHVAVAADAAGYLSIVAPFRLGAGLGHDGTSHAGIQSRPRFTPEVGLPDAAASVTGSVQLEVVLALMLSIESVPLGGPCLATSFGVILEADPVNGLAVDGAVEIGGDWVFPDPLTGLPDVPDDLGTLFGPFVTPVIPGTGPLAPTSTRWSRVFDIRNSDPAAAIVVGDELTVVEGAGFSWLASLDELGIPSWQSTSQSLAIPVAMARAGNGDIVVAGAEGTSIRLDRFDASGAPVWTRTMRVAGGDRSVCAALISSSSNGVVVAGKVNRGSVSSPLVFTVDENGDPQWSTELEAGTGGTNPDLHAIARTNDGQLIVVGEVDFTETPDAPQPPIDRQNGLVVRLREEDGTVISGFALGGTADEKATRIAVQPDSSYVIGGHLGSAPHTWLASIRSDDTLRWSASYQSRPDVEGNDEFADPTGLAPLLAGDGLLACGTIGALDSDAWVIRVDAEGMPVWVKSYLREGTGDELTGIVALPDGMAAAGLTHLTDAALSDLWVLRSNIDGELHFTADSGLTCVNTAVQWRRLPEHTIRPLAPTAIGTIIEVDPAVDLIVDEAQAFGELVTE